jgi:DNA polymerase-3 subunit epsilon
MNSSQRGYLFGVATGFMFLLGAVAGAAVWAWLSGRDGAVGPLDWFLLILVVVPLVGSGHWLRNRFQYVLEDADRMSEEALLLLADPSARRISQPSEPALRQAADTLVEFASRFTRSEAELQAEIERARADMAQERNRLAALMSELASAVLVCDLEGRILLFNRSARRMLEDRDGESPPEAGLVGLHRSVYGVIERPALEHALRNLHYRLEQIGQDERQERIEQARLVGRFLTTVGQGRMLRVRMAPILDAASEMTGIVLTLNDMTEAFEASDRRDRLLEELVQGLRAKLASIRAAVETLDAYPEMVEARQVQLRGVIREETGALSALLEKTLESKSADLESRWQLEEMACPDLLWAIQRHFEDQHGFSVACDCVNPDLWLKVETYSLVRALAHAVSRLRGELGVEEVGLRLREEQGFAALDLTWSFAELDVEMLCEWQRQAIETDDSDPIPGLKEVASQHGGEAWFNLDRESKVAYFRLLLPIVEGVSRPRVWGPTRWDEVDGGPPENYDFELLERGGDHPEIDRRPLATLGMTIFDTETTGTDIEGGDRVISIAAVRIVKGRLLAKDIFDQLVDPERSIPPASTRIHGLVDADVQGMPLLEEVLPRFARFCEDTVLVAHNASFDLRLLQRSEEAAGVRFDHPVLDTLFLSRLAEPEESDHRLESIAERLGVEVKDRHTALGDSVMTARCLLRLLPLLEARGIHTLADARSASHESFGWRRVGAQADRMP